MKKILICFISLTFLLGCSSSKTELYKATDSFVKSLQTNFESYGLEGKNYSITTSDGQYTITPIGRLINVKVLKSISEEEYEKLRIEIEKHYKNDTHVNKVFICEGGTIMIDCRN